MRVACYARYSSDLQRETSLEDQLAVARRYASGREWTVLEEHVYSDAGISGASIDGRAGLEALLAAAALQPRPFDVVLVDDSSRVSRDIADAVRFMQRLTFWGIRVIYISQGIDSASEQAESLVAVHGLIDSLYLKELAKKVKRGLAGQHERGYATGSRTFGYRTVPEFDPSGRKDHYGDPLMLGKRIEIIEPEAATVRQIFEWSANGLGASRICERLNTEGWPQMRGGTWKNGAVRRVLTNERYLGRHIWGQVYWERVPGTRKRIQKTRPRQQWNITERPDLRIVSDELWERVQATRAAVRHAVAPKKNLARGRDARHHSPHLFSGFIKCAACGGAIMTVSGGRGSPRYGCSKAWRNGPSACSNRLTGRVKVIEPKLLGKLQRELLEPATLAFIVGEVKASLEKGSDIGPERAAELQKQLGEERRKRQNLIAAIEGGADVASVLSALKEREATISRLEVELAKVPSEAASEPIDDNELRDWIEKQLHDLHALLKDNPARVKEEFRRLNLHLTFNGANLNTDNPYFIVNGQCDLSALAFSFWTRAQRPRAGATVDRLRARAAWARSSSHARYTARAAAARGRSRR